MYDKEQIHDEQIAPLMTKIIEICKANEIPMLASYYLKQATEFDDNMYCTTCLFPDAENNEVLSDAANVILNKYTVQSPFLMAMTITNGLGGVTT